MKNILCLKKKRARGWVMSKEAQKVLVVWRMMFSQWLDQVGCRGWYRDCSVGNGKSLKTCLVNWRKSGFQFTLRVHVSLPKTIWECIRAFLRDTESVSLLKSIWECIRAFLLDTESRTGALNTVSIWGCFQKLTPIASDWLRKWILKHV